MLYRPKLATGNFAPLAWPIALFRKVNNICWPLAENAPLWAKVLDFCCLILFLGYYVLQQDATIRFLKENFNEMDEFLDGLIDYIVNFDMSMRTLHLCYYRQRFKKFLKKYYAEIYIEKSSNPELFLSIQNKLRPTYAYSYAYVMSGIFYVLTPFIGKRDPNRDLSFPMIYPFDISPSYIFLPAALGNIWLNVIIVTLMFGDANIMSEALMHLNGQYLMLGEDLQRSSRALLKEANGETISHKFGEKLKHIIQRNVELNEFAAEMQEFYSHRIFLMFLFSATIICILAFTFYTKVILVNILWMSSKIAEMLAIGEIGSTIIATTDSVSSIYYHCNWELIISCSTNSCENVKLMKLLLTAMETNQKPFTLMGLKFFSLSVTTVMKILQAAGSYFTWLLSIREN